MQRVQTEETANKVELVFDYRDLVDISRLMPQPSLFINEQLDRLKEAGVQSMAMFESSLIELETAQRIEMYTSEQAFMLQGKVPPKDENYTYVLFLSSEDESKLSPLIEKTFIRLGINVKLWKFEGKNGLIIETPRESAVLKPMPQDPLAVELLRSKGFTIVPRISDTLQYNEAVVDELLAGYKELGVKRILFDGDAVKGFNDDADMKSLANFAGLLNKYDMGVAAIEGLKSPQQGMNKLAYMTKYNVARIHSINEQESFNEPDVLGDRMRLAVKDRNIRMIYLNASVKKDTVKAEIVHSIDNLINSLKEPGHALAAIEGNGFTFGQAVPFEVHDAGWQRYAKMIVVLGGVALIALLISYFAPYVMLPAFVLGAIGCAGLYVLRPVIMEQALALGVSISAPTIAMVLAIRRIEMSSNVKAFGARVGLASALFLRTALISLLAVPYIIALLNNITYSLVITQFRGVSLLHLAPIALTALYVFLYRGESVISEAKRWLNMPIKVFWVVAGGFVGVIGLYYMSRTGNAGSASQLELAFRWLLEDTLGVRPRMKEFMFAHPVFLVGAFIAFRYRWGLYLFIIAAIGQLSMVDTFAHIHTPVLISVARTALGLGLGFVVGLVGVVLWSVAERCWDAWRPKIKL
ncbi:DUF5693 family protein [Paenibacillus sp. 481]|uniref:DUF5693 family protein n=1 Tax=Paenibacillus sp. 481 TaxID=2835869 RepID=UPI003FA746C6